MKNKTEKFFFVVVMTLATFIAIFHFVRLSAGWSLIIAEWELPTLLSGFIIVVSVFVVYWGWLVLSSDEENEKEEEQFEIE